MIKQHVAFIPSFIIFVPDKEDLFSPVFFRKSTLKRKKKLYVEFQLNFTR